MSIVVQCPHCETRFNLQSEMNGKSMRCPNLECRQVFTLRKVYGYSGTEIASRLGIPEHAVEEHLIQAARRCAQADPDSLGRRPSLLKRLRLRIVHL